MTSNQLWSPNTIPEEAGHILPAGRNASSSPVTLAEMSTHSSSLGSRIISNSPYLHSNKAAHKNGVRANNAYNASFIAGDRPYADTENLRIRALPSMHGRPPYHTRLPSSIQLGTPMPHLHSLAQQHKHTPGNAQPSVIPSKEPDGLSASSSSRSASHSTASTRLQQLQQEMSKYQQQEREALRDAQLQHAVVLGGRIPMDDSLAAIAARYYCEVCGVATTSEINLQDHIRGRKHQRRASRAAVVASQTETHGNGLGPKQRSASASALERIASFAQLLPNRSDSLSRNPSYSSQMNRGEAAAIAGNLQRMPSGNVYDGFPCIRIGDFVLPSSMDFRQYLDEMQQIGEMPLPQNPAHRVGALLRAASLAASQAAAAADLVANGLNPEEVIEQPSSAACDHVLTPSTCQGSPRKASATSPRRAPTPRPPLCASQHSPSAAVAATVHLSDSLTEALSSRHTSFAAVHDPKASTMAAATAAIAEVDSVADEAESDVHQPGFESPVKPMEGVDSRDSNSSSGSVTPVLVEVVAEPFPEAATPDSPEAQQHQSTAKSSPEQSQIQEPADVSGDASCAALPAVAGSPLADGSSAARVCVSPADEAECATSMPVSGDSIPYSHDPTDQVAVLEAGSEQEHQLLPLQRQLSYAAAAAKALSPVQTKSPVSQVANEGSVAAPRVSPETEVRRLDSAFQAASLRNDGDNDDTGKAGNQSEAASLHDLPQPSTARSQSSCSENNGVEVEWSTRFPASYKPHPLPQPIACDSAGLSTDEPSQPAVSQQDGDDPFANLHMQGALTPPLMRRDSGSGTVSPLAALSDGCKSSGEGDEIYSCELCDVTTSSMAHLKAHFLGKRHQRRLSSGGSSSQSTGLRSCPLCCVTTTSVEHMELHLAGRAHQRKLRILEVQRMKGGMVAGTAAASASEAGDDADPSPGQGDRPATGSAVGAGLVYVCRMCNITTTSPENLQAHFDGALHKKKLRQAQSASCAVGRGAPQPVRQHRQSPQGNFSPSRYHQQLHPPPMYHSPLGGHCPRPMQCAPGEGLSIPQMQAQLGMHPLRQSGLVEGPLCIPMQSWPPPPPMPPQLQRPEEGYLPLGAYTHGGGGTLVGAPSHAHMAPIQLMGVPPPPLLPRPPPPEALRHPPHQHFSPQLQRSNSGPWQPRMSPRPAHAQPVHFPAQTPPSSIIYGHPGPMAVYAAQPQPQPPPSGQWAYITSAPQPPHVGQHMGNRLPGDGFCTPGPHLPPIPPFGQLQTF